MTGIFEVIRKEHAQILRLLDLIEMSPDSGEIPIQNFLRFENEHHRLEEELLFNKVLHHPRLREGGPFCTLYFDQHVVCPPRERFRKLAKRTHPPLARHETYRKNPSPLDIPLEEHAVLSAMTTELLQRAQVQRSEDLRSVVTALRQLLLLHIEKEENCFFRLCEAILTPAEMVEIHQQWVSARSTADGSIDDRAPADELN